MSRVKDETGNRYGRLTVIERAGSTSGGIALWKCRCDCGNETVVAGSKLRNGLTVSCGCKMRESGGHNFKDLVGQKFGYLTVIRRVDNIDGKVAYECKCDCGKTIITKSAYLLFNGKISCGCKRQSKGENIIEQLGTEEIKRIRVGIGEPMERDNIDFVLSKPIKEERVLIDEAINDAVNALKEILKSNFDRAMTKFN